MADIEINGKGTKSSPLFNYCPRIVDMLLFIFNNGIKEEYHVDTI